MPIPVSWRRVWSLSVRGWGCTQLRVRRRVLAAAGVRRRRAVAPAALRPALRRRPHLLVSLLLAAGRRRGPPAWALPAGGRLARGVDPRLLAGVPRSASQEISGGASSGCARTHDNAPSASHGSTPSGCATRVCAARSRCSRGSTLAPGLKAAVPVRRLLRARGHFRRPSHSGEAGSGDSPSDRPCPAGRCRGFAPRSSETGPSAGRSCAW